MDLENYQCELCDKTFWQEASLKRHDQTIHEGHKEYKCKSCSKLYSSPEHLKTHILITHEGFFGKFLKNKNY